MCALDSTTDTQTKKGSFAGAECLRRILKAAYFGRWETN